MKVELRTIRVITGDIPVEVRMEDLHKGDMFTMTEADGTPVGGVWHALDDGEFDPKIGAGAVRAEEIRK